MQRNEKNIEVMYGEQDLAQTPIFQGGFINFGYWRELPEKGKLTVEDRIESSKDLYREIFRRSRIKEGAPRTASGRFVLTDVCEGAQLLEVGCGRGLGCDLALKESHPSLVTGVDASAQQIARTQKIHASTIASGKLQFIQGPAEKIPLNNDRVDCLYSVEAAQHFSSIPQFLSEAFRVIRPGGRLALTTFFARNTAALEPLADALPTVNQDIDRIIPIVEFLAEASRVGFWEIDKVSIGDHVFEGFDRWIEQTDYRDSWGRNWLKVFNEGWLDYYIITAQKPLPDGKAMPSQVSHS